VSILNKNLADKSSFFDGINRNVILAIIILLSLVGIYLSAPKKTARLLKKTWQVQASEVGVGSPRLTDINNDGVVDIILGAGFEWSESEDSSLMAIDGKTGDRLWRSIVPEAAYATPILVDVNGDGILDATASGRFSDVLMLNGANGDILWQLSKQNPDIDLLPCNFNSPSILPDLDNDGVADFAVVQGGLANQASTFKMYDPETNALLVESNDKNQIEKVLMGLVKHNDAASFTFRVCNHIECEIKTLHRDMIKYYSFNEIQKELFLDQEGPGGRLFVVSSRSGKVLANYAVPKDRESWSSPIFTTINGQRLLIYGSGGERRNGFLHSQNLDNGSIHWSIPTKKKGVLSSPLLYAENGRQAVVAATMDGEVYKIDAATGAVVWAATVGPEYETYSSVAIIKNKDKSYSDIVSVFSFGVFPNYDSSSLFVFDGRNGDIIFRKKIGYCHGASSPLIADIDDDTHDDIVLVTCTNHEPRLIVLNNAFDQIFSEPLPSGSFATPAISDIDSDGHLDIIVPSYHFITRYSTEKKARVPHSLPWPEYRGPFWNGVSP
jgi:outer membrane protein assembly factor BamB